MNHPIILAACKKHGIDPRFFLGYSRSEKLMACRQEAMQALRDAGYPWKVISEITGREAKNLLLWINPEVRARKNKRRDMLRKGLI